MNEEDFEGSVILEKLAELGKVDEFFDAVDSDDFAKADQLMKQADISLELRKVVLKKMANSEV